MSLLKKACFVYFIFTLTLLFVSSYEDYERRAKYNADDENDNKTCNIPWETSLMSEPYPSCWLMCKGRCIILSRTTQWRCKMSPNEIFGNCHCCCDDNVNVIYDF
ncbi:uncharacterized protein LOC111028886 [Myzus persicae]|uniref:uncharacterized protein LOC111028886 n=1 Tax=Myzus persicae TaxID=13164 RepID=UPI000B9321C7|nr:uncharacterized protein LOC111028886 [Myzus persicae]